MLLREQIHTLAMALDQAEKSGVQISQFSLLYPHLSIEDAYAIQHAWVSHKLRQGSRVIGHKIGLTSRTMQQSSNINEPDYGALLDNMQFSEGSELPMSRFITPRVEVELAFVLEKPLWGPHCSIFDVLAASQYVIPAIEIIDARIQPIDPGTQLRCKISDTISDNAASAGIVLGGRAIKVDQLDLRRVAAVLYRNGVIEESGVAAAVLNHPAKGVAWLANKLYDYGVSLQADQLILSGSFTRPVSAQAGDCFYIDYHELGTVAFRFI
ncbi:2-oxohept-3-enedioate hydratase [Acinetobacter calcoaceticus]|uniref:2-oxohept-3-enedioate hydratase n=1 Tax=Acinetobacter calcoaceticus TaxID=471 RepID=A0A4R1XWI1_ACICA|nr:2-oxohept-3-enedioate hydratase [Acinetobacter calcoaceticus]